MSAPDQLLDPSTAPADLLSGCVLPRVSDGAKVDLGELLSAPITTMVIFGTYPADFNMIEYAQKMRHYWPQLKAKGVDSGLIIVNGSPAACRKLSELLNLPEDVELLSDEAGEAGRLFGVSTGWLPESGLNPYLKLFGMLWGLGASATLPSVITGYLGNPWGQSGWIESSLAQGQKAGRWPNTALELDSAGAVKVNKFAELPVVGGWGRRPLELATLRLQSMLGVSLGNWKELAPSDDRCLTQLGGCALVGGADAKFLWRDGGICNTADFEEVLAAL
eukprot:CAMPEP_0119082230 /NCGR_PEP_ID=MMETSP1178-20130426/120342_1 /TAXON_ID=33656 /ORGANISM="unid sp, Strain CCMP2000" /LENGTH=276 /DNA_ID=CAMNT_0007064991 /DNA_START=156 /DNA_END=986 /DNA_ORIENTATION=+